MASPRRLLAVTAVALAFVAGACADLPIPGREDGPSRAEFLASVEPACAEAKTRLREAGFVLTALPEPPRYQAYRDAVRRLRAAYLAILDARPPAGETAAVDGFATAAIAVLDALVEATTASERNDPRGQELALKRAADARPKVLSAGQSYGFSACLPQ